MAFRDYWSYIKGQVAELSPLQAQQLVNLAWGDIRDSKQNWSFLCAETVITVPDTVVAGTVTVTQDSPSVLADATAKVALDLVGSTLLQKRIFRSGVSAGPIYNISAYDPATGILTLDRDYYEATAVGSPYQVYKCYITPPSSDFKTWLSVKDPVAAYALKLHYTREELNRRDPYRGSMGLPFWVVSYAYDSAGLPRYELWPHPIGRRAYPSLYRKSGSDLSDTVDLPSIVPSDLLMERGLYRAYEWAEANKGRFDPLKGQNGGDFRYLMDRADKRFQEGLKQLKIHDENLYLECYGSNYLLQSGQTPGIIDAAYWQSAAPWYPS